MIPFRLVLCYTCWDSFASVIKSPWFVPFFEECFHQVERRGLLMRRVCVAAGVCGECRQGALSVRGWVVAAVPGAAAARGAEQGGRGDHPAPGGGAGRRSHQHRRPTRGGLGRAPSVTREPAAAGCGSLLANLQM